MIKSKNQQNIKIIPLGGFGEVGRNMLLIEYQRKILIIDMGFRMPEEDMPGVDYIVPNISYLKGREKDVVGIAFTHGHYDHIGAVPYLLYRFPFQNYPMFASRLTRAIILKRQGDFPAQPKLDIEEVVDGSRINLPPFGLEFFKQNHNIADNFGILIKTPVGNIIDTSDFKFDQSPVFDLPTNFEKIKELGQRKILLLMCDSTGAEEEGHSLSESEIFANLEKLFKEVKGRIIAVTFGSLINRIQQIIALSEKYGRKVAVDGYTMRTNVELCKNLGYIKTKKWTFISPKEIQNYPDERITFLCTGAQGETEAILMRIANREYRFLKLKKEDTVIFSSSVVPGNERTVQILKDELYRQKARVFHYKMMDIHAGGHAQRKELAGIIKLLQPKFFLPIHGQYSMLVANSELAKEMGIPEKDVVVAENGQIIGLNQRKIWIESEVTPSNYVMVDGLGIGDVGEVVLRDRQMLAEDGMFVIVAVVDRQTGKVRSSPDIISRGFVYLKESKELLRDTRKKVISIVNKTTGTGGAVNWVYVKNEIRDRVGEFLYQKTQRRPMILPVVIEI